MIFRTFEKVKFRYLLKNMATIGKFNKLYYGNDHQQVVELFELLVDHYTLEWLESDGFNPIQQLWLRSDEVATIELLALASGIKIMESVNAPWLKKQIKKTKQSNFNNSKGAVFEIICFGMLHGDKMPVALPKNDQPGYDGILNIDDTRKIRLSLKNFGLSEHERVFRLYSQYLEKKVVQSLYRYDLKPFQVIVIFESGYPGRNDWLYLIKNIDFILSGLQETPKQLISTKHRDIRFGTWSIYCKEMEDLEYDILLKSYTFCIMGSHHHNEQMRIFGKIDKACENLLKHSKHESSTVKNALFISIPNTSDIETCNEWVKQYFKLHPEKEISFIALYQSYLSWSIPIRSQVIGHRILDNFRKERFEGWPDDKLKFEITLFAGRMLKVTRSGFGIQRDGKFEDILTMKNVYSYQRGREYRFLSESAPDELKQSHHLSPGIISIPVIIDENGNRRMLAGRFAPDPEFLLI